MRHWRGPGRTHEGDRGMIRSYRDGDHAEWLRMRRALWADCPEDQQVREIAENLTSDTDQVFVAERPEGGLCGFLEPAIRPWAIGCKARPVGYVEGCYVDEDVR